LIDRMEVATNPPGDLAGWMAFHGMTGASEEDDRDGDGFPLLWEFAANGDPSRAGLASYGQPLTPRLVVSPQDGSILLTYRRRIDNAGMTYDVESSPSLDAGGWSPQAFEETSVIPATDGITEFVTLRIVPGDGQRFFRVVVEGPSS
jgi:hypothetical protein